MASRFLTIGALLAAIASAAPAGGDGCLPFCQSALDACNAGATTVGNPNHPLCASWFSQCLGYNPYNGKYVAPTACADVSAAPPIPTSTGAPSACAGACLSAYQSCSGSPGQCAYQLSSCLGNSPFYDGLYVAPTSCNAGKENAQASASGSGADVTTVVASYTTYCPGPTSIVHGNKTITVTGATTLTVTDCPCTITTTQAPAPQPTAAGCLDTCNAAFSACQNVPGANMAVCAAQYSGCLGYNPWVNDKFVTPTACATSGAATATSAPPAAPTVVVTAGAAGLAAPGALAALGALALL